MKRKPPQWIKCPGCGVGRWISQWHIKQPTYTGFCRDCGRRSRKGEKHPCWKGGRYKTTGGYIRVLLRPDNFFYSMGNDEGYVLEHRFVMAKHLGRCLQRWENIHHKNGVRDDNRLENLELQTARQHIRDHSKGYGDGYNRGFIDGRGVQVKRLKQEIEILKIKLKEAGLKEE